MPLRLTPCEHERPLVPDLPVGAQITTAGGRRAGRLRTQVIMGCGVEGSWCALLHRRDHGLSWGAGLVSMSRGEADGDGGFLSIYSLALYGARVLTHTLSLGWSPGIGPRQCSRARALLGCRGPRQVYSDLFGSPVVAVRRSGGGECGTLGLGLSRLALGSLGSLGGLGGLILGRL